MTERKSLTGDQLIEREIVVEEDGLELRLHKHRPQSGSHRVSGQRGNVKGDERAGTPAGA